MHLLAASVGTRSNAVQDFDLSWLWTEIESHEGPPIGLSIGDVAALDVAWLAYEYVRAN